MKARIAVAGFLVALVGCPGQDQSARPAVSPKEVAMVRPARRDIARELALPVELWAWQSVAIYAKVTGYISAIEVDRGSRVKEGDVLARVSVPELEDERAKRLAEVRVADSEVSSARADHELQKLLYERVYALVADRAVTQQDVDVAFARLSTAAAVTSLALAKAEAARKNLAATDTWIGYTTVRAPFTGVVTERTVHVGALVAANERTLLFNVAEDATMRAVIDVPEVSSLEVVPGTRVRVEIAELGKPLASTVARSAQALDPRTRTLRVEADLENREHRLFPGMFGQAVFVFEVHEKALVVPAGAVARTQQGVAVFTLKDRKLRRTPVETGFDDGKFVEVLKGLGETEPVAAEAKGLADGTAAVAKGDAR
jgi:RND family efflux transporter MFP subunit